MTRIAQPPGRKVNLSGTMYLIPRRFFRLARFLSLCMTFGLPCGRSIRCECRLSFWKRESDWYFIRKLSLKPETALDIEADTISHMFPFRSQNFIYQMWLRSAWNTFIVNTREESESNNFGMTCPWLEYQESNISELFPAVMENLSSFKGVLINYSWRRKALAYNLLFVSKTGSKVH